VLTLFLPNYRRPSDDDRSNAAAMPEGTALMNNSRHLSFHTHRRITVRFLDPFKRLYITLFHCQKHGSQEKKQKICTVRLKPL